MAKSAPAMTVAPTTTPAMHHAGAEGGAHQPPAIEA
jgi:hypothetical protein